MWNGLESKMFLTKASKFDICSSLFFKEWLFKKLKLQFNHVDRWETTVGVDFYILHAFTFTLSLPKKYSDFGTLTCNEPILNNLISCLIMLLELSDQLLPILLNLHLF